MSLVERLRADELESLRSEVQAGRRGHILKTLDERGGAQDLVRGQYAGRYPFELLQNASDAAVEAGREGRVRFVLTPESLIVADNGTGFGPDQIRAICGLGRSSKDPRKSVGYKGLGFKSVGEISATPQILSDGVQFGFDQVRVRSDVAAIAGDLDPSQRLPVYAFPYLFDHADLGSDEGVVDDAHADGFTTILRLPFRPDVRRADVSRQLLESLTPRLLVLLTGIGQLELVGAGPKVTAVATRTTEGDHEEVLLEVGASIEHWLVYRRSLVARRELLDRLEDAWREVETVGVAVAVPLGEDSRPSTGRSYPLHVYFPTEEDTGLPILMHGDFSLQLDRRRLATTPEASPYNAWLLDEAADLAAAVVAPALARRFPSDPAAVVALAPKKDGVGLGAVMQASMLEKLGDVAFVGDTTGGYLTPRAGALLPTSLPDQLGAADRFDLTGWADLVALPIQSDPGAASFLSATLGSRVHALADTLARLRHPDEAGAADFYRLLVEWAERAGVRPFAAALSKVPVVRTAAGHWIAPSNKVFFPRRREDIAVPPELPVPILDVPPVEGLEELLRATGVRDFEWRELLNDYLLPLLLDPGTEPQLRTQALSGLRVYHQTQRGGDHALLRRIRSVLLPARSSTRVGAPELVAAERLYYGTEWTGSSDLERLYGPFGQHEFLDSLPPEESEQRSLDMAFFTWMGVSGSPKVLEAETEARDTYKVENVVRHPHHRVTSWDGWWREERTQAAARCEQGHSYSQQLRASYALDRVEALAATKDPARLLLLWSALAANWASDYQAATRATFHCQHQGHAGLRDRTAPSLLMYQLTRPEWVPARLGDDVAFVAPGQAWRLAPETPGGVARRVPLLARQMVIGPGVELATRLGVTDAARPSGPDLAGLLRRLRRDHEAPDPDEREISQAARWAMRRLNDVLDDGTDVDLGEVPLLARRAGRTVFDSSPVVTADPLLAETWEEHFPVFDGDRDLRRLFAALGLRVLDDPSGGVAITPLPRRVRPDALPGVRALLNRVKPFLAAAAIATAPSREREVIRGLNLLELVLCEELILSYTYEGIVVERPEAVAHMAVRTETIRGAIRRNVATAYLELDPATAAPDWYVFGPQLANYLSVAAQGDAFAVLMTSTDADRWRYLAARRINPSEIDRLRQELDLPADEDDLEALVDFLPETVSVLEQPVGEPPAPDTEGVQGGFQTPAKTATAGSAPQALPPIDLESVEIHSVDPDAVERTDRPATTGTTAGSLGPSGPVDHARDDELKRTIGHRGEEVAFEREKARVRQFGDDDLVVWVSQQNPFAPYDIESVDADGQRIYIEVKSTTSADPTEAFPISKAELLTAVRERSRYYIYRVTSVSTATPSIFRYQDPAGLLASGKADAGLKDARMRLGIDKTVTDAEPPAS
ncbi:sacsin N-terminal ATP-binding-like domain-containing protein [Phycicoccus sp. Soil803]|uniref:sacsin N-terminal ATP-binding-like domain-containing protein n=1 Tax=Phycicoccus sp. Soil803 TaxID=1736415 RepID=UPI00070ED2CB|nr:DUF3883 domain-containing protein [Phycicoccus sp. Soil803]KRF24777.1 hypothetical protein ASG95_09865 [Phycicoccus sp. Soil803]